MVDQWDYEIATYAKVSAYQATWKMAVNGKTTEVPDLVTGLRAMGTEGWELVTVTVSASSYGVTHTAIFKRRKP